MNGSGADSVIPFSSGISRIQFSLNVGCTGYNANGKNSVTCVIEKDANDVWKIKSGASVGYTYPGAQTMFYAGSASISNLSVK